MKLESWHYFNPVRIQAGSGVFSKLSEIVISRGKTLLVTSPGFVSRGVLSSLIESTGSLIQVHSDVLPNPQLSQLDLLARKYKGMKFSAVIGLGGGSVVDTAKILSLAIPCEVPDPLEMTFRHNVSIDWDKKIPLIAIPTTAGTGSEVTPFATIWDDITRSKYSLSNEKLFPEIALLDPQLTLSLPEKETLYSGLDSVSHALESLWNINRNPISESYAVSSLKISLEYLPKVLTQPQDVNVRGMLQVSSLFSGLAISQTKTAIAHSISYPLTNNFHVPHGLACSFSLVKIINHYLEVTPDSRHKTLMRDIQKMLQAFNLYKHLDSYVGYQDLLNFLDEMVLSERANNFDGPVPDLNSILTE